MQKIILTQSYDIFIPDAKDYNYHKEIESIEELRECIKSVKSQLDQNMTHRVSVTRNWCITTQNQNELPVMICGPWNKFRNFNFFVVNGKIPTVSDVTEYIKSQNHKVYPAKNNMRQDAPAYHEIGLDPNLHLLGNNIVTDMDLKQIRPHATSKEPTALLRFFGPVVINNRLKLR